MSCGFELQHFSQRTMEKAQENRRASNVCLLLFPKIFHSSFIMSEAMDSLQV